MTSIIQPRWLYKALREEIRIAIREAIDLYADPITGNDMKEIVRWWLDENDKDASSITDAGMNDLIRACWHHQSETRRQSQEQARLDWLAKEVAEAAVLCEKCGGLMELRCGRYGAFIGCGNYPICKNTTGLSKREKTAPRSVLW